MGQKIGKMNKRVIVEQQDTVHVIGEGLSDVWFPALNGTTDIAESGTTTTNITIEDHGLLTGDYIINTTRSNALRQITKVDADNFTVTAVTSQTDGDSITLYPYATSKIWAHLQGSTLYLDENAQRKVSTIYKVTTRYRSDLDITQRLRIGERNFEILGMYNIDEKGYYLQLKCRELKA
jgi:SPP1 family predicted phage head-tail adaptor